MNRSLRVGFMCVSLTVLMLSPKHVLAQDVNAIKDRLAAAVSNKSIDYKVDHTSDIKVLGNTVGKRGKEFLGTVKTKGAEVTGTEVGNGFNLKVICKVKLSWEATWQLKNFIGIGYEYKLEQKNTTGELDCTVEIGFGGILVKDEVLTKASVPNHDSTKMPYDTIAGHLFSVDYLKSKIFP